MISPPLKELVLTATLVCAAGGCRFSYDNPVENQETGGIRGQLVAVPVAAVPLPAHGALRLADADAAAGDADAGEPVVGASCTLEGTNISATSDDNGVFELLDIAVGSYILICREGDRAYLAAVEVRANEVADLGTIEITPTGQIEGRAQLTLESDHTGIAVTIPGTTFAATTAADGHYALTGIPRGAYTLRFEKAGYRPFEVPEVTVTPRSVTLLGDVVLTLSTGPSGTLLINNGEQYSVSPEVTVTLVASPDATLMLVSESQAFVNASWEPFAASMPWTFSGDGLHQLFVKFADTNGLESPAASGSITVDTTAPDPGSIYLADVGPCNGAPTINFRCLDTNGDFVMDSPAARSVDVVLQLNATDASTFVSEMKVSSDPTFTGVSWQPFAATQPFELPSGDGPKMVYATFRDCLGHESPQPAAVVIVLDTVAPVAPAIELTYSAGLGADPGYTSSRTVLVAAGPAKPGDALIVSDDPTFTGATPAWGQFEVLAFTMADDGEHRFYAREMDAAGNESDVASAAVILDTTPPTTPGITVTVSAQDGLVRIVAPSSDANLRGYQQFCSADAYGWQSTQRTDDMFLCPLVPGLNRLGARAVDRAGNVSEEAWLEVTF